MDNPAEKTDVPDEKDEEKLENKASKISITKSTKSTLTLKKKGKKKKKEKVKEVEEEKDSFDLIKGVTKLPISPITQKVLGCIIGEHVTAESQWTYLDKEKIMDNIDLHSESSDFLAITDELTSYPEKDVLVGFIPEQSLNIDMFYVVHDVKGRNDVLKLIDRKKRELQESLKKAVSRPVGKWSSLGSENLINANMIQSFRPLYEVEVASKFPVLPNQVRFTMRNVEDARDGYVEFLSDPRYPVENVKKKRIDAVIQASPCHISSVAQTNPTFPTNVWTQYEYEYDEAKVEISKIDLNQFMLSQVEEFNEKIHVNEHINFYQDDYAALVKRQRKTMSRDSEEMEIIASYANPDSSEMRFVNDCTWNTFMSGTIAVSYTNFCMNDICKAPPVVDCFYGDFYTPECPLLLWSYAEELYPKLFLQSPRQVMWATFSPFRKSILVGGCLNGQLIVWDLQNKLEEIEKVEVLTSKQELNRHNLMSMMHWMKNVYNPAVVEPVMISSLHGGHSGMVTAVKWLFPTVQVTINGKVVPVEEGKFSEQFMSGSVDGTVIFWDLHQKEVKEAHTASKTVKMKRLPKKPSALTAGMSEFKAHDVLLPTYKLLCGENEKNFPILCMFSKIGTGANYEPVGSYSPDPKVITQFNYISSMTKNSPYPFITGSATSDVISYTWDGLDYVTGRKLNTEQIKIQHRCYPIHDGPVWSIVVHPLFSEYILTTGGNIFGIWNIADFKPLLWRKCTKRRVRYVKAGWVNNHPSCVMVICNDGSLVIWDFLVCEHKPSRIISIGGDTLLNMYGTITSMHCRKGTLTICDCYGTINVIKIPILEKEISTEEIERTRQLLERLFVRRSHLDKWMEEIRARYEKGDYEKHFSHEELQIDSRLIISASESGLLSKKNTKVVDYELQKWNRIFLEASWMNLGEQFMFETMLKRKNLDLNELAYQKRELKKIIDEKRAKLGKQQRILESKPRFYENAKISLFQGMGYQEGRKYTLAQREAKSHSIFLESYNDLEIQTMRYIENKQFSFIFNWHGFMLNAARRIKEMDTDVKPVNVHNRHLLLKQERLQAVQDAKTRTAPPTISESSSTNTELDEDAF